MIMKVSPLHPKCPSPSKTRGTERPHARTPSLDIQLNYGVEEDVQVEYLPLKPE
jgi:hypothetical protein